MPSYRAIDYLVFGMQLPTSVPQPVTLDRLQAAPVAKESKAQQDGDKDDSSDADSFPVSCHQQQLAGKKLCGDHADSTEVASLTKQASTEEEQDAALQENVATPRMRMLRLPMPARTCETTPELWNCKEIAEDTKVAMSPHGRGRAVGGAEFLLGRSDEEVSSAKSRMRTPCPAPQRNPYGWGACVPPPPGLSHAPSHFAPLLKPMSTASPHLALSEGASGEAVVSAGPAGHPFCRATPCKYYTKSKKGCKDGDMCKFCHECKWTKSCKKKTSSSPMSA